MRRADRRLAQRATPLALVLVACATVTVDCSPSRSASVPRGFEVTVLIDGHPKSGHLDRPDPWPRCFGSCVSLLTAAGCFQECPAEFSAQTSIRR